MTPASNAGFGIHLGGSINDATFSNMIISSCSRHGVVTGAGSSTFSSCEIINNGLSNPDNFFGIFIADGSKCVVSGCRIGNTNAVTRLPQASCVGVGNNAKATITTNNFSNFGLFLNGFAVQKGTNADVYEFGNIGYISENYGVVSIVAGSSSTTVTHNLNGIPADYSIQLSPLTSPSASGVASFWASNITATTFDVNVNTNVVGPTLQLNWFAKLAI